MFRRFQMASILVAASMAVGQAAVITIDFNDGTDHASVGSFYSGLGVTFSNASWDSFGCFGSCAGLDGLHITDGPPATYVPKSGTPIIATFSSDVSSVSIFGLNVGDNGARMDAYDATTGGALIGTFSTPGVPGVGADNNPLLSISATGIRRIQLYQPLSTEGEGLLFDRLTFETSAATAPEPTTFAFVGIGIAALAAGRRFIRRVR
jgi:hypothetical protein